MNIQLLTDHLTLIGKDTEAWINLFAEDAVVEFPYAAALNLPERFEGKSAIYNHIKKMVAQMQDLVFTNVREYQTSNPNVLLAEVHGETEMVATGRHYQQDRECKNSADCAFLRKRSPDRSYLRSINLTMLISVKSSSDQQPALTNKH